MERLGGYHCLAPDLPGHGRSNRLPWASRTNTADRIAALIERRVPSRRAHVVGLSLGGSVAHTLLARRADLLDHVVIDGCGALPWRGTTLLKTAVAAVSPVLHTRPVIAAIGGALRLDDATRADLRAASPRERCRGVPSARHPGRPVRHRWAMSTEGRATRVAGEPPTPCCTRFPRPSATFTSGGTPAQVPGSRLDA